MTENRFFEKTLTAGIRRFAYGVVPVLILITVGTGCRKRETLLIPVTEAEAQTEASSGVRMSSPGGDFEGNAKDQIEISRDMPEPETVEAKVPETAVRLQVFVCGKVRKPGVYTLDEGSRVNDAVDAAGGFTENADREWLNLAALIHDGERIDIPDTEQTAAWRNEGISPEDSVDARSSGAASQDNLLQLGTAGQGNTASGTGRVNLNTAGADELMTLPGIGKARAEAIIEWRSTNGPFSDITQITQISGIKGNVFEKIRDLITV